MDFLFAGNVGGWSWGALRGALRAGLVSVAALRILWLVVVGSLGAGSVDNHLATHEGLIVEDLDGALGFFHVGHVDKPVAFGFVSVTVVDELDLADGADAFEEFFQVILRGIVGEVADIEARGLHFGRWGSLLALRAGLLAFTLALGGAFFNASTAGNSSRLFGSSLFGAAFLAVSLTAFDRSSGLFVKTDSFKDFLPKGEGLLARTTSV